MTDTDTRIRLPHKPTDFSLIGSNRRVPHDIDFFTHVVYEGQLSGLTHRGIGPVNHFLCIEIKRPNENLDPAVLRSLRALSLQPNTTVLLVNSAAIETEQGYWLFSPTMFRVLSSDGVNDYDIPTSSEDFKSRYDYWCRCPSSVSEVWGGTV
jgi:hypothetical protein